MTRSAPDRERSPAIAPVRIQRRKVYELVAEQLIVQVAGLQRGDVLPSERELTEAYGVGRSSVREALRVLESRGLIDSRASGPFVVADPRGRAHESLAALLSDHDGDIAQLFEVRRMIEGEAAALAAARRTDEHVAQLEAAIAEMAAAPGSEERFIAADVDFHLAVAEATGNRVMRHLMHAIRDQLREAFGTVFHIPGSAERSVAQHREIAAAISLGQPDEARRLMLQHVARVESEFVESAAPHDAAT